MTWKTNQTGRCLTIATCAISFLLVALDANAQNEIAWQISSSATRPIDTIESPVISNGFALVGVGPGVGVYNLESGAPVRDIFMPAPNPERRTFAASDGRLLITDSIWAPNDIRGHSRAYVFDIASGEKISQLELPTPTLRLGLGASLAMDDRIGVLTSLSCLDTCFDEERFEVRGVVDAFELSSGKHLFEIVSPDNAVFGQGLAVGDGVIAVSSRSRSLDVPGRVHLYDTADGAFLTTLEPSSNDPLHHNFGFDLAIDGGQLVVGDNPDLLGHGVLGDGKGRVSVFRLGTNGPIAEFSADHVELEGTPRFATDVAIFNGSIFVSAPSSGIDLSVAPPESTNELDSGACAQTFSNGGPCFERFAPTTTNGTENGRVQLIDVATGGWLSPTGWDGGDAVAMGENYALVLSTTNEQSNVYAISLAGLLSSNEDKLASLIGLGDINNDGRIEFGDFLILSANYGQQVQSPANGDIDGDGLVGFTDFLILSENFSGKSSAESISAEPISVPEPRGQEWILLGFCCLMASSRQWRQIVRNEPNRDRKR